MALTPDEKKRLAALDSGPEGQGEGSGRTVKAVRAKIRASTVRTIATKALIVVVAIGVAAYFITANQLHRMNFKKVFSSGSGTPISRFVEEAKLQKEKSGLLDKGYGHLLMGEYDKAFKTAKEVEKFDPEDPRPQELISEIVDAVAQKAVREFDSGEIDASLKDVRTALKHRSNHKVANALYGDIADRLMLEAKAHHEKKEYEELIAKAKETVRIDPTNMAASILLRKANGELHDEASLLFVSKRYAEALAKVKLSLRIDPTRSTNPDAHRILDEITNQIASPHLELRSIISHRGKLFARIQLSGARNPTAVEEGDTVSNFKVIDIDPGQKLVLLKHLYTGKRTIIRMKNSD